jgi:DnaJ-class molecular chaperone
MHVLVAALAVVIAAGAYVLSLRIHPYTFCRRCNGTSRNRGSSRARFGSCRKCGGTGRTERLGRRILGIRDDR